MNVMKKQIVLFVLLSFLLNNLCADEKWTAKRIASHESQNESNAWTDFVKTFDLEEIPSKAIASIACDSKYWMWINGELVVFEGQLKRGPTPEDTYYDKVDITGYLKTGPNKIAILLWYFGKEGFSHNNSGQAGLVFQCDAIDLLSDASWDARIDRGYEYTSRPYPNYRLPESNIRFDAQRGNFDWVKPGAQNRGFRKVKVLGNAESEPWNNLFERPIPHWKNYGMKNYEKTVNLPYKSKGDTLVCKLPYNAHITPYFKIKSEPGKVIEIRTDHYYGGGPPNVRAEYVTSSGIQEYESLGWMNGHYVRYYFPEGVEVLELKFRETGYDAAFTGSFDCNDSFYNKMWQKALRTLYVTMRDTYMDCPDRERAQWWGDLVNESGEAFYALSPSAAHLTKKGMLELINWQREDGTIYSPIPSGNYNRELPGQMLASIGYYGFWNYYLNTGDKETIEKVYDGVKRYLDVWQLNESGILKHREGDWYWGDWGTNIDKQGLFNAWYYLALKGYRNMSEVLGKNSEAARVDKIMTEFKAAFNKQLWNGKEYRSAGYEGDTDDRAQALAVVAGLADSNKYPEIYQILKNQFYASPYMEKYVIEALFLMGYEEYGLQRLKDRFYEMVNDPKLTTLYEGWGVGREGYGGGTVNHAWSGGGLTILSQYVCGVSPVEPAWKTIRIQPQLGNLSYATTENITVNGKFSVEVNSNKKEYKVNATIPEKSNAIVCIPDSYKKITLNEQIIWDNRELKNQVALFIGKNNGYYQFKVEEKQIQVIAQ
jgi:alpha-L-rhamnosidase